MLHIKNLSLTIGQRTLFQDLTCTFETTDRIGIIGRNGAGKSTLLKVIAGLIQPTSGEIHCAKNTRIGYLPQEEVLASDKTVFEEAFSAFDTIVTAEQKINIIEQALANNTCSAEQLEEYAELQAQLAKLPRHDAIKQTHDVLTGLGFTEVMEAQPVSALSTGWKMRLALAKLLLTDADFYLFDEPTNHLDIVTQQWLLEKLCTWNKGFALVSHDRVYLEKACNAILEIERGKGTFYRGNLSRYLEQKEHLIEIARATRERQEREIAQKQATVDRFRAGTRSQQAKNIMKQIERIELVDVEPPLPTISFQFPTPARPGSTIVTARNLSYGFHDKTIFKNIAFEIQRGERVALVAANGVGKTTLINCITGRYTSQTGSVQLGHNVTMAIFEQEQARALDQNKTIFQEVQDACPKVSDSEIRSILGAFQFSGDDAFKKIKVLSGGEKNRVAMAKVLLQRANFLVLDEPTNHLDLYAKDVLCQALSSYEGTMLFVSHDLDFVNKLATRIIELTPTSAYSFSGNYDDYRAHKKLLTQPVVHSVTTPKKTAPVATPEQTKILRKKVNELERTINKLEQDEQKTLEALGMSVYGSHEYKKLLEKVSTLQKDLKQAHADWEAAMEQLV